MQIKDIIQKLERYAPLETQEDWDNSGWQIFYGDFEVKRILLCLTPTISIINQAKEKKCNLIISHHPFLFPHAIPLNYNQNIPIYSLHTNADKCNSGTTDTLAKFLGYTGAQKIIGNDFLRACDLSTSVKLEDIVINLKKRLNLTNLRVINNKNIKEVKRIYFCAGSGSEFIKTVEANQADMYITGDVKYHDALDSNVIIADIGHFESERPYLEQLQKELSPTEAIIADETSPFINY